MMKLRTYLTCALVLPGAVCADELPLYVNQGNELSFTGDMLSAVQVADLLGGQEVVDTFGPPVMIVKNVETGKMTVSYISPEVYELAQSPNIGDGVVENRHDDLAFDESEGSDLRDDLTFSEDQGADTREDLQFSESEGTDTRNDLDFSEAEALVVSKGFDGPADFYTSGDTAHNPQDGTWAIHIDSSEAIGCPPGIAEVAASQVVHSGATQIHFSVPHWRPTDINSDYARFVWTPIGQNGYFAEPFSTGVEAAGSGMSLNVTTALSATSDTQINVWSRVLLKLAPAMAAIAGGSETCTATITGRYVKS